MFGKIVRKIMDKYGKHSKIFQIMRSRHEKMTKWFGDIISSDVIDRVSYHQPVREYPTDEEMDKMVEMYTSDEWEEENALFPMD